MSTWSAQVLLLIYSHRLGIDRFPGYLLKCSKLIPQQTEGSILMWITWQAQF